MEWTTITANNYAQVATIYEEGIHTELATFETEVPSWEMWNTSHLSFGRIALLSDEKLLGWASLSPVSSRCVYGGVAEVSLYVASKSRGKGIGKKLLTKLIAESETNGIWTLQAGVMRGNIASIQVHLNCGFREIGYRERIGKLKGKWLDNIILERRSTVIGI